MILTFRGTYTGDEEEIKFVKDFNKNKEKYSTYLSNFVSENNLEQIWMVRVTSKQISKLSNRKVFTRADSYLISLEKDINELLSENDYYLSENILDNNSISYKKIPKSGVSVKMSNSNSYQIIKLGPNSFENLFKSYELGAGASLYCKRENELYKNIDLISGWKSSLEQMVNFFQEFTNNNQDFYKNKDICKDIKNWSCDKIYSTITNSPRLKKIIFNGEEIYKEPYTAYYFYQDGKLTILDIIPFYVTTGSGRSRGDYTIVLKPKL